VKIGLSLLYLLYWHLTADWNIVTLMDALTLAVVALHWGKFGEVLSSSTIDCEVRKLTHSNNHLRMYWTNLHPGLEDTWVEMINLPFVLLKGHC